MKPYIELSRLLTMSQDELAVHIDSLLDPKHVVSILGAFIVYDESPTVIKPMICVHLDTISKVMPTYDGLLYNADMNTLELGDPVGPVSTIRCLGGDDRCGVYVALQLLMSPETSSRYSFGFFYDEESGCKGSKRYLKYLETMEELGLSNTHSCFLGIDRKTEGGVHEIAKYGSDNDDLVDLIDAQVDSLWTSGTYTDCSVLAEGLDVACMNFTAGYQHEHSIREIIYIDTMLQTLEILKNLEIPSVIYEATYEYKGFLGWNGWTDGSRGYDVGYAGYTGNNPDSSDTEGLTLHFNKSGLYEICCDYCGAHSRLYDVDGDILCITCINQV